MTQNLKEQTQSTISTLLDRIVEAEHGTEAMQCAQAILNLVQAHTTYSNTSFGVYDTIYGFQTDEAKELREAEKTLREQALLKYAQRDQINLDVAYTSAGDPNVAALKRTPVQSLSNTDKIRPGIKKK